MIKLFDIEKELNRYGLSIEQYEQLLEDCSNKVHKISDLDWSEICDKYNLSFNPDTIRKGTQPPLIGSVFVSEFYKWKKENSNIYELSKENELNKKLEEIRKERIKIQTANIERNRLDRSESRQELYYENVGSVINTLPLPEFKPILCNENHDINYLVGLADIHYGAWFKSVNNEYSPEIANERFEYLTYRLIDFIQDKNIEKLTIVSLGDLIQGILRLNDLKINDTTIMKATVDVCRLIALMLNKLSEYAEIAYYHTPTANHTQIRVLNAKPNELADEDLEYLMGNYIHDLCVNNKRIHVHLAKDGEDFIDIHLPGNEIIAMHGHQIKNIENSIRDKSILHKKFYNTLIVGHLHSGKVIPSHEGNIGDAEVLVSPSFVGSDPYSDSLNKGSKASVKIYGFDKLYGHTETYKIILN